MRYLDQMEGAEFDRTHQLYLAAGRGKLAECRTLIAAGTEIEFRIEDEDNESLLHAAVDGGNLDIVRLLVAEHGRRTALGKAAGPLGVGEFDDFVNAPALTSTPLQTAISNQTVRMVRLLLKMGASPFRTNGIDESPLQTAAEHGTPAILTAILLACDEENSCWEDWVNDPEPHEQMTPLHLACRGGRTANVRLLLSHNADADVVDYNGRTPLCVAAQGGFDPIVRLLLDAGADPNLAEDPSPLAAAVNRRHEAMVRRLLRAGAGADGWLWGETALHIAKRKRLPRIRELLVAAGATNSSRARPRKLSPKK
ncbi:MAG TPA: ankyrin repeat domain-containing protein [Tepidisphaeraceae bacterium]|nr:ankyrin repeat domain-containing protein [Tepidisphaeraceae bacterium]